MELADKDYHVIESQRKRRAFYSPKFEFRNKALS